MRYFSQALFRLRERAGQKLAFGPVQFQLKDKVTPTVPGVLLQESGSGREICKRRVVRGRSLGALTGNQV